MPGSFAARSSSFTASAGCLHRQHGEAEEALRDTSVRRRAASLNACESSRPNSGEAQ